MRFKKSLFFLFFLYPFGVFGYSSDGFDYPVGKPDGVGYYDAQDFGRNDYYPNLYHLGEDWNGNNCGDCDLNYPIYSIGNGTVKNQGFFRGWGGVIVIEHVLPNGSKFYSQYGHLNNIQTTLNQVVKRGDYLAGMSKGDRGQYLAHLHFEVRTDQNPKKLEIGQGYSTTQKPAGWLDPSDFIDAHRPIKSDPINLTSTNTTYDSTVLNWNKPTFQNFDHYELYRSSAKGGTDISTSRVDLLSGNLAAKNIETLSFEDKSLSPETTYFYKICAFNSSGFYVGTTEIEVKTLTSLKNLTNNNYNQVAPSISGKYITWFDQTLNKNYVIDPKLYVYDITTESTAKYDATEALSGFPRYPSISGSKIAYQARSVTNQNYGDQNIYYYDLEKNGGSGVPITEKSGDQVMPHIYKNLVVWQDDSEIYAKNTDLYYIDLSKGEGPRQLVTDPGLQRFPRIWEDKVIYVDNPSGTRGADVVTIIDVNTKARTVIPGLYTEANPNIHAGKAVWLSNKKTYVYDLTTGGLEVLNLGSQKAIIKDGRIIYQMYNGTTGVLKIYNLSTRKDNEVISGLAYVSEFDYENGYVVFSNRGSSDMVGFSDIFLIKTIY